MIYIKNVVEYYDELFPVTEEHKNFYENLISLYSPTAKLLRVDCGTGLLEHELAKRGYDVTGIESFKEILNSANLKRRNQLMAIRFLLMSALDMTKFLGKGFYNIISILNNKIIQMSDEFLMRQFFSDCKLLLADKGTLVVEMTNFSETFDSKFIQLPVRESIRVKLFSEITRNSKGEQILCSNLETGNGKMLPVIENKKVFTPSPEKLISYAKDVGFCNVKLYSDFKQNDFTRNEPRVLALFS